MKTDTEYLQCLGLGLQGLRASGQFCDAMVCVGSTRILVSAPHTCVSHALVKGPKGGYLDFSLSSNLKIYLSLKFPLTNNSNDQ